MDSKMFLAKYDSQIYALLRVVTGFLFLCHGSQKLFGIPPSEHIAPLYITMIAGPIEFFGGLMIMIGLQTSWVAFICSGQMAFAYWYAHGFHAVLPMMNDGELSMVYCFLFLFISARGSGIFSVDNSMKHKKIHSLTYDKKAASPTGWYIRNE